MNMIFRYAILAISFLILISCKKSDEGAEVVPSNLVVQTTISLDGSGKVTFTATADNAVTYDFEFGNGDIMSGTNGSVTYTYTLTGTNTYSVTVTAKSNTGTKTKKTVDISVTVTPVVGLFWSEEFNVEGSPDGTKWMYDLGAGGWGNSEAQYYTNRTVNAYVQGGVLKITAMKESYSGSNYTSARIITKGKFAFTYGRVEVRAKLPAGGGTWPAIWMLGSDFLTAGWPGCGEIDIMEHKGNDLNRIYGTLHYPGHSGGNANGNSLVISNATTEFHIYSLEWSASLIKIFVDNQLVHTFSNNNTVPFNHDFFFILNVAMGGTFGGTIDSNFTSATMEVDYIRVYK